MAAASKPEAVFSCANAQGAQSSATEANKDRNFIFIQEVPILAARWGRLQPVNPSIRAQLGRARPTTASGAQTFQTARRTPPPAGHTWRRSKSGRTAPARESP